jgi:hypothetical protein
MRLEQYETPQARVTGSLSDGTRPKGNESTRRYIPDLVPLFYPFEPPISFTYLAPGVIYGGCNVCNGTLMIHAGGEGLEFLVFYKYVLIMSISNVR